MKKAIGFAAMLTFSSATFAAADEIVTDWSICIGWGGFSLCVHF